MVNLNDISGDNESHVNSVIKWKSDINLCNQIMAKPVLLNQQEAKNWIANNTLSGEQLLQGIFVLDHPANVLVGIARIMFIDDEAQKAEVGIYIGENTFRGKAIGKAALGMIIDQIRSIRSINKLYAQIRFDNAGSINLFRSFGFIKEGLLPKHFKDLETNQNVDVLILSKFFE